MKRTSTQAEMERLKGVIASRLLELRLDLVAVYVFGSFATDQVFSDIDVGILLSEKPARSLILELDLESELEEVVPCPVDVRVLNGGPLSFVQNVIRTGEVVVDRDPNRRADYEGWILKKYFDFAPFRARYLSEAADAPL